MHLQGEGHPIANDPCYGAAECTDLAKSGQSRSFDSSEDSDNVSIWLHALYHGGEGWAFRSVLPQWARHGRWEEAHVSEAILQVLELSDPARDSHNA